MCSLLAAGGAVEAAGHEVAPAVLLEQAAVGHLDAGGARHLRVGVFDRAVAFGSSSSLSCCRSTPSNFSSQYSNPAGASTWPERTSWSPGSRRSPPWRARRRPRCRRAGCPASPAPCRAASDATGRRGGEHLGRQLDEGSDVDLVSRAGSGPCAGRTPARPSRAADVAEALDRVEAPASGPGRPARRRSARCRSGPGASRRAGPAGREGLRRAPGKQ